jgi:hypothetical protein
MTYYYEPLYDESGFTGKNSDIFETELDFVPTGNGIGIDMNNVDYQDYVKDKELYEIVNGKLIKTS